VGIVSNDQPHARSEERGALSRVASIPLELMSSLRSTSRALRRTLDRSLSAISRARANPSGKIPRFQCSEEHRSLVFSPAEPFRKLRQFVETHNFRRKSSPLEIVMTFVELAARLPVCFSRPEGQLPPTEKLALSSKKSSSENRPPVGFPSL